MRVWGLRKWHWVSTSPETNTTEVSPDTNETNTTEVSPDTNETNTTEVITPPVADTTAPIITLLGQNPITIEALTSYSDAGATIDEDNATLTQSGEVNSSKVGIYTVTYLSLIHI